MNEQPDRPVGLTQKTGFQIGARRTFPVSLEEAWNHVISPQGIRLWLGTPGEVEFVVGASYRLDDGSYGEIRVFKPYSHLRLTWQAPAWPRPSTIQVRVLPNREKSVVAFHQEHLPDAGARAAQRDHFQAALDGLERLLVG